MDLADEKTLTSQGEVESRNRSPHRSSNQSQLVDSSPEVDVWVWGWIVDRLPRRIG